MRTAGEARKQQEQQRPQRHYQKSALLGFGGTIRTWGRWEGLNCQSDVISRGATKQVDFLVEVLNPFLCSDESSVRSKYILPKSLMLPEICNFVQGEVNTFAC